MNTEDKKHILKNLNKENLFLDPFPYFIFDNLFPEQFYNRLINMKPLDDQFEKTDPNRTSNQNALKYRRRFSFIKNIGNLDEERKIFWKNFVDFFTSHDFIYNLLLMLKDPILERYKINELNELNMNIRMELIRDSGGYMIAPHTDSPKKILTLLIYIPNDNENLDLGTSLFEPKDKEFISEEAYQFEFKNFKEIKKMPYKKNFAFGFLKNERSFHGRSIIDKKFSGKRDWINYSLQHKIN
tara:strand:- start:53 stop:775 length:723 start_codon:yes stop_codon:yes gene_type:complete